MKYLVIAALAMTAGWYLLDGRFSYMDNGTYRHCVDRLTGERAKPAAAHLAGTAPND